MGFQNNSRSVIDNVFIDRSKTENYIIGRLINGLYNREALLIEINNKGLQPKNQQLQAIRKTDKYAITDIITKFKL